MKLRSPKSGSPPGPQRPKFAGVSRQGCCDLLNLLISFCNRLYALLLWLYPSHFRTAFGEEMQDVYAAAIADAAHGGMPALLGFCLREWVDLPSNLLQEHWTDLRKRWARHQLSRHPALDLPSSWAAVGSGTLLFLVAGLALIAGEVPHDRFTSILPPYLPVLLPMSLLVLPAIGFGIGWIQGFPRWSYPYVMAMVMFSLYMMGVATQDLRLLPYTLGRGELWGWRAWLPGLSMAAVALFVSHSLQPAIRLFANVWEDWTLLTWGMFGTMPLLIGMGFDEIDRLYALPFMIFLTVVMASTAVAYLRSRRVWQQFASLLIGTVLTVAVVAIVPALYWSEDGWGTLPGLVLGTIIVVAAIFSPVFIGLLHRSLDFLRVS